jgi:oxygen-independent coproporphyrinogen III oxidase
MAGIYIHIPFCKQACHYCDFHFSTSLKYKDELLQSLIKEIRLQKNYLNGETIETIYFGGGTPSLLGADEVNQIIGAIADDYSIVASAEITLEANPDDLNKETLQSLLYASINRLSIGVQSFFDEDLIWMNRAHRANESETCIKRAQDIGFENLTVDLIYGYPLLTDQKWKYNLDKVFDLAVPHISSYGITVEPKTALASFIKTKKQPVMNDKQGADQFVLLMDAMAQNGFEHYEISNFCKPAKYSKHNSNYWKGVKYLGIGPSAHSYNSETRQWNVASNAKYLAALETGEIPAETEVLSETEKLNEYIMTSLRTIWGLDLEKLNTIKAGAPDELSLSARKFFDKDWISQKDDTIYLTQTGKLFADHIASELFF